MEFPDVQELSDDEEVFTGEFTLKEVKKRLLGDHIFVEDQHRISVGYLEVNNKNEDANKSVKIIETHSTPNLLSSCEAPPGINKPESCANLSLDLTVGAWDLSPDDSFLELEKIVSTVSTMNISPQTNKTKDSSEFNEKNTITAKYNPTRELPIMNGDEYGTQKKLIQKQKKSILLSPEIPYTPCSSNASTYSTPAKNIFNVQEHRFVTPSPEPKTPVFKTPGNPVSHKKKPGSHIKKSFEHVVSPVASYINNSPSVPLIKDVRPRKPLPGVSCIPKSINRVPNVSNKENRKLPSFAYKSAKETKMIDIPDKSKLPQSQWAKTVASSIHRALVIKHDHREMNGVRKVLSLSQTQEDSFANLSMHQADVSVCTQQSAVKVRKF